MNKDLVEIELACFPHNLSFISNIWKWELLGFCFRVALVWSQDWIGLRIEEHASKLA